MAQRTIGAPALYERLNFETHCHLRLSERLLGVPQEKSLRIFGDLEKVFHDNLPLFLFFLLEILNVLPGGSDYQVKGKKTCVSSPPNVKIGQCSRLCIE